MFAVIGCAGTVGLWGLVCWMRDRYGREILAATKTMKNQKSTIDAMSESHRIDREQILALKHSNAERDETINGMIAKTVQMLIENRESVVHIARLRDSVKKQRCELIEAKRLAREIFAVINPSSLDETPPELATEPKQPDDQPQKPTCDN